MLLRRNESGSWKARVRIDRGGRLTKRLIEIGLGTRDYEEARLRASIALRLAVAASITHEQDLKVCDADLLEDEAITFSTIDNLKKQ